MFVFELGKNPIGNSFGQQTKCLAKPPGGNETLYMGEGRLQGEGSIYLVM